MANATSEVESDGIMMNSKLKSPNHGAEHNTMDSFQDGGQQNMNLDRSRNDFLPNQDGNHMDSEMNNYPPSSGEASIGNDNFGKMNDSMARSQAPSFNSGFNRGNYTMAEQHGGLTPNEGGDFPQQNNQFSPFGQQNMRPGFPQTSRSGPLPGRPGMPGNNVGMMPSNFNSGQQQRPIMSGPSIQQQGGPTPTLNQLLQNANSNQRYPGMYGDYGMSQQKGGPGDMSNNPPYNNPQWGPQAQQRGPNGGMNPYQQHMAGNPAFRNQGGMYDPTQRRPGMPGYPQQGQGPGPGHPGQPHYGPGQFSPNSMPQRPYGMGGQQVRPGMPAPPYGQQMSGHYGQQENQMGFSGQPNQHYSGPPGPQGQMTPGQGPAGQQQTPQGQPQQQQQPGQSQQQGQQSGPQTNQQGHTNQQGSPGQKPGQPQQGPGTPGQPQQGQSGPQQGQPPQGQQQSQQQQQQQQSQGQNQQQQHSVGQQQQPGQQQLPQQSPQQNQQNQQAPSQPPQQQGQQQQQQNNSQDSNSSNSTDREENGADVGNNSRSTPTSQGPQHPAVMATLR